MTKEFTLSSPCGIRHRDALKIGISTGNREKPKLGGTLSTKNQCSTELRIVSSLGSKLVHLTHALDARDCGRGSFSSSSFSARLLVTVNPNSFRYIQSVSANRASALNSVSLNLSTGILHPQQHFPEEAPSLPVSTSQLAREESCRAGSRRRSSWGSPWVDRWPDSCRSWRLGYVFRRCRSRV